MMATLEIGAKQRNRPLSAFSVAGRTAPQNFAAALDPGEPASQTFFRPVRPPVDNKGNKNKGNKIDEQPHIPAGNRGPIPFII